MGQFYKGTEATFIDDAMFKLPYELMGAVIDKKDKAIDDTINQYQGYLDKLKADVLEQDSPELRATIKQYQDKIDTAVQGIMSNPMDYQKFTPGITTLARDIANTWSSTGKVGTMEANKKKVLAEYEAIDKLHEKDPKAYDANYVTLEKQKILSKYKGVQWDEEKGKATGAPDIASSYYGLDIDEKWLAHMKATGVETVQDTPGGPWVYRHKESRKTLTPAEIQNAYITYAQTDTSAQAALERRKALGDPDFQDVGLNSIYVKVPELDAQGKGVYENGELKTRTVLNPNNFWAKRMSLASQVYKQNDTSVENTLSNNEGYWKQWQRANEVADKEKENITAETVDSTLITTRDATIKSLGNSWTTSLQKVNSTVTNALEIAKQLKITGPESLKQIKNGNFTALRKAGANKDGMSATIDQLEKSYKRANAEKQLANASIQSFKATLPANLQKEMEKPGWTNNKAITDAYSLYTEKAKAEGRFNQNNEELQVTSMNGMDMDKNTKESFKKVIVDDMDKFQFKLDDSKIYESAKGTKLVFSKDPSKIGKTGTYQGQTVTFVKNTGVHSLAELQQLGIVSKAVSTEKSGTKSKPVVKYNYFENGKEVGMDVAEDTFGVVKNLDNSGQANMGVHIQMGKNTIRATLGVNQITSPQVQNWFAANDDNLYLENQRTKTNWGVIDMTTKDASGQVYRANKGKYTINGVERTDAASIKIIQQAVMGL